MIRLLGLLVLLAVALVAQAPAWLAASAVRDRSAGVVELRDTEGTLWNGRATAVIHAGTVERRDVSAGVLAWRLAGIDWKRQALRFDAWQTPAAARPATVTLARDWIRLSGSARLPAAVISASPWTAGWTFGGELGIDSDDLAIEAGGSTGAIAALWRGATLTPPDLRGGFDLGEVSLRVTVEGGAPAIAISNRGGDLNVAGSASSRTGRVDLQLQPRATATPAQTAWLQSHTTARTAGGYAISLGGPVR